jgi:hypothetical protein
MDNAHFIAENEDIEITTEDLEPDVSLEELPI